MCCLRKNASISFIASLPEKSNATKNPFGGPHAHHDGFKCVDVGTPGLVLLFDLNRIPLPHKVELVGFGLGRRTETGKMCPSIPMSPTLALLGMPPKAMTAQFSNSNGGRSRNCFSVQGRSRTTKPRHCAAPAHLPGCGRHLAGSCLAMTRAGGGRDVDADPLAFHILGGDQRPCRSRRRRPARCHWVRKRFRGCGEEACRLLRGISEALIALDGIDVVPNPVKFPREFPCLRRGIA